jgi:hypothetical protein
LAPYEAAAQRPDRFAVNAQAAHDINAQAAHDINAQAAHDINAQAAAHPGTTGFSTI